MILNNRMKNTKYKSLNLSKFKNQYLLVNQEPASIISQPNFNLLYEFTFLSVNKMVNICIWICLYVYSYSRKLNVYNLNKPLMEIRRSLSSSRLSTPEQHKNQLQKYQIGEMLGQGQFGKVYKVYIKNNTSPSKNQSIKTHLKSSGSSGAGEKSGKKQSKYSVGLMRTSGSKNNKSVRQLNTKKMFSYSQTPTRQNPTSLLAMKIIPLSKLSHNPKLKSLLLNQVHILNTLTHPWIIKFHNIFVTDSSIHMLYEYCEGGSLEDRMPLPINSEETEEIFYKIVKACAFAEKNNILHRDLKPANVLFKNGEPRVADWGFSRYLDQGMASSFVGSPAYMAPQILKGKEYTSKADVWSFGVMMYQSLYNKMPWPASSIKQLLHKLQHQPLSTPGETTPTLRTLLKLCLQTNPQKRASFQKLQKLLQISRRTLKTQKYENPQKQYSNSKIYSKLTVNDNSAVNSNTNTNSNTTNANKKYFGYDYVCEKEKQIETDRQRQRETERKREMQKQTQRVGESKKSEKFSKYGYFGQGIQNDRYQKSNYQEGFQELDQNDIKKCSRYLQFAKTIQRIQDDEAKMLCLELIVTCLRNIKNKYQYVRHSQMTPCLSQRKMNLTKRESRSPQTCKKQPSKSHHISLPQTHQLLQKQILLIKKMQKSLPYPHPQPQQPRTLIRHLLKKMLKNITVSQKIYNNQIGSNTQMRMELKGPSRKQLLEMNDILEVIMYEKDWKESGGGDKEELENGKEKGKGKGRGRDREVWGMGVGELIRMVNCRILYVNRKYCQKG